MNSDEIENPEYFETKYTIEEKPNGDFEVTKFNKWEDGRTLILENSTHPTKAEAVTQNEKNITGFWT